MTPRHLDVLAGGLAAAVLLAACGENNLSDHNNTRVAVTTGDFDRVAEPLVRMEIAHTAYEGIISTATWDPTYDAAQIALKVEDLLGDANELDGYSTVFVASGTRGLGGRRYNSLDPDDQIVSDGEVIDNVQRFVDSGGVLIVTDWGYDLVEVAWPDAAGFLGEDGTYDAAQRGVIGDVSGRVVDDEVAEHLEFADIAVHYNYSNQAIIESVGDDTRVIVRGTVQYTDEVGTVFTLEDAPLMVVHEPRGASGRVVLTTFHLNAQGAEAIDALLLATVGRFQTSGGGTVAID